MTYIITQKKETKERIHVSKILCLGLNYLEHIAEMKSEKPAEPLVFMKPPSAIIHNNGTIVIPPFSKEAHHEVEIVVAIGKTGKNIATEDALSHIFGFGIGIDVTLRDIQNEAKKKGKPWVIAKGFDTSAPISDFVNKSKIKDLDNMELKLLVNGATKQQGNSKDMIFKYAEIIAYLSTIFTLNRGDLIFTGTPEGVGQIKSGDKLKASLNDLVHLNVNVE